MPSTRVCGKSIWGRRRATARGRTTEIQCPAADNDDDSRRGFVARAINAKPVWDALIADVGTYTTVRAAIVTAKNAKYHHTPKEIKPRRRYLIYVLNNIYTHARAIG